MSIYTSFLLSRHILFISFIFTLSLLARTSLFTSGGGDGGGGDDVSGDDGASVVIPVDGCGGDGGCCGAVRWCPHCRCVGRVTNSASPWLQVWGWAWPRAGRGWTSRGSVGGGRG